MEHTGDNNSLKKRIGGALWLFIPCTVFILRQKSQGMDRNVSCFSRQVLAGILPKKHCEFLSHRPGGFSDFQMVHMDEG